MSRRLIPCPQCGNPYGGQGKVCLDCFVENQSAKSRAAQICPSCGGYKHRQSQLCWNCHIAKCKALQKWVGRTCPECGIEFPARLSEVKRGSGIFCGRKCATKAAAKIRSEKSRVLVVCAYCEVEFEKLSCAIRKTEGDLHFCSLDCWYQFNQGENHYGWLGGISPERQKSQSSVEWKRAKKEVWKRDGARCQRCKIYKNDYLKDFHVHHIVSFSLAEELRTEPSNLVLLCKDCHYWVHSNANEKGLFIEDATSYAESRNTAPSP